MLGDAGAHGDEAICRGVDPSGVQPPADTPEAKTSVVVEVHDVHPAVPRSQRPSDAREEAGDREVGVEQVGVPAHDARRRGAASGHEGARPLPRQGAGGHLDVEGLGEGGKGIENQPLGSAHTRFSRRDEQVRSTCGILYVPVMLRTLRLLHEIATPAERRWFVVLVFALAVSALLETVSVAIIFPFVAAVADPSVVGQSAPGRLVLDLLGMEAGPEVVAPLGVLTLAVVLASALVAAATTWSLNRFMWGWLHSLSSRLLLGYLRQSYAFFLGRNTAELAKNMLHEVDVAVGGAVAPTMMGLARGFVAVGLVTLLLLLEPVIAVGGALVIGVAYAGIYLASRGRQGELGKRRLELNDLRHRHATEVLTGIKAVKTLGKEAAFLARYESLSSSYARATGTRQIISLLPKNVVEAVAVGGGLMLVLLLLSQGRTPADVLPVVGVFAFAGYKLLPAVQQLFFTATNAHFHLPALERLAEDLRRDAGTPGEGGVAGEIHPPAAPIELRDVHFRYEGAPVDALKGVSATFEPGLHYGLVGRTGSGKSTALDVALGLLAPTGGEVRIGGEVPSPHALAAWRRSVGYVPQDVFLLDASVRANIGFGEDDHEIDENRLAAAVEAAALEDVVAALPDGLDTEIGERGVRLSGGQRQRVGIARALYRDPEVIFFDEGTSALDGETEGRVVQRLRARGRTLVMVAHRLASVEQADRILVFDAGSIVARGTAAELARTSEVWRAIAAADETDVPPSPTSHPANANA